jgi:putative CocE/NonD family hydrolase
MLITRTAPRLVAPLLGLGLVLAAPGLVPAASAAPQPARSVVATTLPATPATAAGRWRARAQQYPNTVTRTDLPIKMSDGVTLRADLTLPADASGKAVPGRFPVIVTVTPYNKTVLGAPGAATLGGPDGSYLVKRGYAKLLVDVRGTGSSEGSWNAFDAREDADNGEIVNWAHKQPWSNGKSGMSGPSYMGMTQLFGAATHPAGLKAIFPQVPGDDVYRDVVGSGGQLDVGFIPLWLGLIGSTSLVPPAVALTDPASGFGALLSHLFDIATFTIPLLTQAMLGADPAYAGAFYDERSPGRVINKVDVPTFFVSGEYDLFQRGTPLLFENLRNRGINTKLIIGPWDHLQASAGTDIGQAGYGSLQNLQLRWFDHYVKGIPDPTLNSDIPPLTYYEQGSGAWRTSTRWIGPQLRATTYKLSGSATTAGSPGGLTTGKQAAGTAVVLPIPVSGLCTRSANQWTAGIENLLLPGNPCLTDNTLNDLTGVVFQTAPVTKPVSIQGPINAHLYVSSSSGDGMIAACLEDVAPNGTVSRLTGGWQVISLRQLDKKKSRYLDGKLIQPWHRFTKASQHNLPAGAIQPVDVEIFPTGARIKKGHRLRIALQEYDVPHLSPVLPEAGGALSVITIHNGSKYPSSISLPTIR